MNTAFAMQTPDRHAPHLRGFSDRGMGPLPSAALAMLISIVSVRLIYVLRPLIEWSDLYRYVQNFSINPYYGMAIPQSTLEYATNEYGWQLIVRATFAAGLDFEAAFVFLSMVALGLTIYAILRQTGLPLVLLLLINPAIIDFFISQVRSALALAIVLNFVRRRPALSLPAIAIASTIHTSMLLFTIPIGLDALRRKSPPTSRFRRIDSFFWPIAAIIAAAALTTFQTLILDLLGDRRAAYGDTTISTGPLLTIAWGLVAMMAAVLSRHRATLSGISAAFMIGMYVVSALLGLYAHRYAAFFLPFLAMSIGGSETPFSNRLIFVCTYFAFSSVYFSFWI